MRVGAVRATQSAILTAMTSGYWMTVRDVAAAIRKSEPTVRRAVRRGDLVAHVFGERGYSIAPGDLAEFIGKSRAVPGGSELVDRHAGVECGCVSLDCGHDEVKGRTDSGDVAEDAAGSNEDLLAERAV